MPSPTPAWLFDAYPHPRRSCLVVWVKHGSTTSKLQVPYQPDFCVKAETEPLETAERLLARDPRVQATWRSRSALWLRGPPEPVLRVRTHRLQDLHAVATSLRRATRTKGFLFFDVDHQPESRWMHAQRLFPMCRLRVGPHGPELRRAPGEDRWTLDYPTPELVTLRLAARAAMTGPAPDFGDPLVSIQLGEHELRCARPGDPAAEAATLRDLGALLRRLDPDVLTTMHGDRWDVPFLLRRIRALGLEGEVRLGRDPDPEPDAPDQAAKSIHTYGRWLFKTHAYYLRGRWHIDLSKKTLDAEDDRKDLHGIVYLARVANCRPQDVNRNGAGYALQQMQIDLATDQGVALPWKRNLAEDWKDAATLCAVDRGGQIMNPRPGVYEDVAACDFSGYYPSLVVLHNLSSDTLGCACCPQGPLVPELGMRVCQRVYGHQAEILRRLWPHRRYVKAVLRRAERGLEGNADLVAKARAIKSEHKAIGVVCFGYFRYRNARFGCAEVHQAIQCYGRQGMTRAREVAHREGFEVVHTLIDCMFLRKPGLDRAAALRVARRIAREVGVPMDVEGVYRWLVLLPSKTHSTSSEVGVPNRYYGKFEDGALKVRGIEVQRHSTPPWLRDVQQGMLDVFQEANDAAGFLARIPRALGVAERAALALRERGVEPEELGLMVQSTMGPEEYRANTTTRAALERLRTARLERRPGEYVKYVVARGRGPWEARVVPVELLGRGTEWFPDARAGYHIPTYLRLLARSVETMLSPFGYAEEPLFQWLRGAAPRPRAARVRAFDARARLGWVRA